MEKQQSGQNLPWVTILFWSAVFLAVILFIKIFSSILFPFVVSLIIAYLLNPIIDWMVDKKIRRVYAVLIVLSIFILAIIGILMWVVPILYVQIGSFLRDFSFVTEELFNKIQAGISYFSLNIPFFDVNIDQSLEEQVKTLISQHSGSLWNLMQNILVTIFGTGARIISVLSLIFLTPVISFYLLLDWNKLVTSIRNAIPLYYAQYAKEILGEMEYVLAGFLRGQLLVCTILAIWFSISLSIIGLPYGALIGIIIGLVAFIPYLGTWIGVILGLGTAIAQFNNILPIIAVAIVLILGQLAESNYLSPKLVGDRVNLHPVWVIFALFASAIIAGFTGILLAVPVAACIGVLVRFIMQRYRESGFYLGFNQKNRGLD